MVQKAQTYPAKNMNASATVESMIEKFEGVRLTAYNDPLHPGLWTIGYGHTQGVFQGMVITEADALLFLERDVMMAASCVRRCVTIELTQGEFDALTDFVFNLGCGSFVNSTLLALLNKGEIAEASEQFERWDHAGGKAVAGLLRRRLAEEQVFDDV